MPNFLKTDEGIDVMPPLHIATEFFTRALAEEIIPLAQQSWDECSEIKKNTCAYHGQRGISIDPNIDQFLYLADHQSLIVLTLRDKDLVLRGYAVMILYNSLHLKTELCGNVDTFYVQPNYRASMPGFMSQIEGTLRKRGVSIIAWPVTMTGKLYKILQRRGYIADDVVMELKLKNLPGDEICA